ncbi:threonine/serine dehydratase [Sinorhizobium americanum]|uniref:Threonine dehydratase n=1 Tax=Sinorhizobium americanum TaxID=194963 RepID=A0A4R2B9S2_9HYPH|nr:threonine/serine dehydratase [Sinorhizobium americanum]TCN22782.1 threonine dehydratase [Sinorhizobium americanum]
MIEIWHQRISSAQDRIGRHVTRTSLIESPLVNDELGFRLLVKAENLQKTGSFKVRGATNFVLQAATQSNQDFVGYSSGNHAQGLAFAARLAERTATVLMPSNAPARKIKSTKALGAEVVLLDEFIAERDRLVAEMVNEGAIFVPPFDHDWIVEGQGTVGLEIVEDLGKCGILPDAAFVPTSGGGLLAGVAICLRSAFDNLRITGVEPSDFDDFGRSIAAGSRQQVRLGGRTICDGLMSSQPGKIPFDIVMELGVGFAAVTDEEVRDAMRLLLTGYSVVAEPSGAAALAAVLNRTSELRGLNVIVVVSGGNVDRQLFTDVHHQAAK